MNNSTLNKNNKHNLSITDDAINRIKYVQENEGGGFLRITVDGGGCSGFSYTFSFDNLTKNDDIIAIKDKEGNPTLVTDSTSLVYLEGSKIMWNDDLNGSAFTIDNPNATSSCGCGTSFSVN